MALAEGMERTKALFHIRLGQEYMSAKVRNVKQHRRLLQLPDAKVESGKFCSIFVPRIQGLDRGKKYLRTFHRRFRLLSNVKIMIR